MAIEFHCPYCTATVRVGLEAAGKVGRCPKCDTRLRVPTLDQISGKDRSVPAPVQHHEPDELTSLLHVQAGSGEIPRVSFPVTTPEHLPGPAAIPVPVVSTGDSGIPAINTAENVGSVTKYLKQKKKEPSYAPLIPPLIFLGIFLVIGLIYWRWSQPKFHGTLAGERLNPNQFIQTDIRADRFTIPKQTFNALVGEFRERPADLRSNLVNLRFSGGPDGIAINLRPGSEADLVQVPVSAMSAVAKYYRDRYNAWDDLRQAEMQDALERMCEHWLPLDESAKRAELPAYRESVAYNAFVRGLGRLCEAVVISGGQPVKYPCVHEDAEGQLYFLVPARTKDFTVVQRGDLKLADGLPGSFKIKVMVREAPGPTFDVDRDRPKGDVETPVEVIPFGKEPPPAPSDGSPTPPTSEPSPPTVPSPGN